MESTGSYWKPVFKLTFWKDSSRWSWPIRSRSKPFEGKRPVLEDANVKIGNLLSDVFRMSGQAMLEALLENKLRPEQVGRLGSRKLAPENSSDCGSAWRTTAWVIACWSGNLWKTHAVYWRDDRRTRQADSGETGSLPQAGGIGLDGTRDWNDAAASILAEIGMDISIDWRNWVTQHDLKVVSDQRQFSRQPPEDAGHADLRLNFRAGGPEPVTDLLQHFGIVAGADFHLIAKFRCRSTWHCLSRS